MAAANSSAGDADRESLAPSFAAARRCLRLAMCLVLPGLSLGEALR
jgi:hypothetical protein